MFAPLKRILILAAVLLFPGVAFSYVTIYDFDIDNWVPAGSEGFVVGIQAGVTSGDTWESTYFYFQDDYSSICLNHDDFGPGDHAAIFYVPFSNSETAVTDGTGVGFYTYNDDSCGSRNNANSIDEPIIVNDNDGWPEVIQFVVSKEFRPASDQDIQVNINCSAGSPGDDSAIMNQDGLHIFPQEFLNPSNPNHNCVITEAEVPAGYQAIYRTTPSGFGGGSGGDAGLHSFDGCFFYGSGNMRDLNTCQIVNVGLPATFTVTKLWEVFQDQDGQFVELDELRVRLGIQCNRDIESGHVSDQLYCRDVDGNPGLNGCSFGDADLVDPGKVNWVVTGDAEMTVSVDNSGYYPVECVAVENVYYSNVERSFTDCATFENGTTLFELGPGSSDGCTFVNTVFFEGIPTLSQYGMALMALLMLGMGFVGFRRFV